MKSLQPILPAMPDEADALEILAATEIPANAPDDEKCEALEAPPDEALEIEEAVRAEHLYTPPVETWPEREV